MTQTFLFNLISKLCFLFSFLQNILWVWLEVLFGNKFSDLGYQIEVQICFEIKKCMMMGINRIVTIVGSVGWDCPQAFAAAHESNRKN